MKKIFAASALIILAAIMSSALCYGQNRYDDSDQELRTFDGRVVNVDTGKSVLTVKGIAEIDFPITSDTSLRSDIYDIKLSDIDAGDYVTVQYYRSGSESRLPSKVLTVTVQNKPQE